MSKKYIFGIFLLLLVLFCAFAEAERLDLPSDLKEVPAEAFYGDTSLDEVILPEGIEKIGAKAFAKSTVKRIYLPESLKEIAKDAFWGCNNVIGYGKDGTDASKYFRDTPGLIFDGGNSFIITIEQCKKCNEYILHWDEDIEGVFTYYVYNVSGDTTTKVWDHNRRKPEVRNPY